MEVRRSRGIHQGGTGAWRAGFAVSNLSDRELIWLYGNATIGVYPSMAEGFGLGVAECLDFGLPISDLGCACAV